MMYRGGNDYTMVFNNIVAYSDYSATDIHGVTEDASPSTGGSIGTHYQYSNNCVSMDNAWSLSVSTHVNDCQGSPSFVDYQPDGSGDYHLTDGSRCTDQGIASLGGAPAPPRISTARAVRPGRPGTSDPMSAPIPSPPRKCATRRVPTTASPLPG